MSLHLAAGEALIAGVRVPVAPEGEAGALRLGGADGPVVRPLTFGERWRIVRYAWTGTDPVEEVIRGVRMAATGSSGDDETGDGVADGIVAVLALHLAGAGSGAPGFATVTAVLARTLGWGPNDVVASDALLADDLARNAVDAQTGNGWNRVVFPMGSEPLSVERVRDDMAADLLRRGADSADLQGVVAAGMGAVTPDRPIAVTGGGYSEPPAPATSHRDGLAFVPEAGGGDGPRSVPGPVGEGLASAAAAGAGGVRPASTVFNRVAAGTGHASAASTGSGAGGDAAAGAAAAVRLRPTGLAEAAIPIAIATGLESVAAARPAGVADAVIPVDRGQEHAGGTAWGAPAHPTAGVTSMPATALARAPGAPISWPSNGVQGRQPAADGGAPPRLAGVRPDSSEPLWDLASPPLAGVGPPGAGIAADAGSHAELLADAVGAELHRIADLRGIDP